MSLRSDFDTILKREQAANWSLADAVAGLKFDFEKPFLPDSLIKTAHLECLEPSEKLLLNQLQGHAYAHLFFYVEEFIVEHTRILLERNPDQDSSESLSLACLIDQERKHQAMFRAFSETFCKQMGYQCLCVEGHLDAARAICAHSDLSVMLLMTMLEWVTQRHYMLSFKREIKTLDRSFCELFRLHWMEESHHTTVDTMELDHLSKGMDNDARQNALLEFLSLCNLLEQTLHRQAELDLENFTALLGRDLPKPAAEAVLEAMSISYKHIFLDLGLGHPVFLKIVDEIIPGNDSMLMRRSQRFSKPATTN